MDFNDIRARQGIGSGSIMAANIAQGIEQTRDSDISDALQRLNAELMSLEETVKSTAVKLDPTLRAEPPANQTNGPGRPPASSQLGEGISQAADRVGNAASALQSLLRRCAL